VNRTTLQKLNTIIEGVEGGTVAYSDLLTQVKALRDELQKELAEAHRGFEALNEYTVVESLLMFKYSELTGEEVSYD